MSIAAARKRCATPAVLNRPPCANIRSSRTPSVFCRTSMPIRSVARDENRCVRMKVLEAQPAVRGPQEERPALLEVGDRLAGEVVVGEHPAAVARTVQCGGEEGLEDLRRVDLGAQRAGELGEQPGPGVQLTGPVVAVHHRHRVAGRRGDQVQLAVHRGRAPARARPWRRWTSRRRRCRCAERPSWWRPSPCPRHPRGAERDAGTQPPARVEQRRARRGERAGRPAGDRDGGQQLGEGQLDPGLGGQLVEPGQHRGVVPAGGAASIGNMPLASPMPRTFSPVSCQCT